MNYRNSHLNQLSYLIKKEEYLVFVKNRWSYYYLYAFIYMYLWICNKYIIYINILLSD